MKKPLISVVMPAYNASRFIGEAIDSVLNQTFTDFEFIIIDDCSTDDTWKIISGYKDKRIRAFRNKGNSGVTVSLNAGLKHARGTYIARMDADDISLAKRFEKQVKVLEEGYDVVGCSLVFIDFNGKRVGSRVYSNDISKVIRIESPLAHPSVMFKRSFLDRVGVYDERYTASQDYDLWIRFYMNGAKTHNLSSKLLLYRQHSGAVKNVHTKKTLRNVIDIKKNAKKKGFTLGFWGELRLFGERLLSLMPKRLVLLLFYLVKRR